MRASLICNSSRSIEISVRALSNLAEPTRRRESGVGSLSACRQYRVPAEGDDVRDGGADVFGQSTATPWAVESREGSGS